MTHNVGATAGKGYFDRVGSEVIDQLSATPGPGNIIGAGRFGVGVVKVAFESLRLGLLKIGSHVPHAPNLRGRCKAKIADAKAQVEDAGKKIVRGSIEAVGLGIVVKKLEARQKATAELKKATAERDAAEKRATAQIEVDLRRRVAQLEQEVVAVKEVNSKQAADLAQTKADLDAKTPAPAAAASQSTSLFMKPKK